MRVCGRAGEDVRKSCRPRGLGLHSHIFTRARARPRGALCGRVCARSHAVQPCLRTLSRCTAVSAHALTLCSRVCARSPVLTRAHTSSEISRGAPRGLRAGGGASGVNGDAVRFGACRAASCQLALSVETVSWRHQLPLSVETVGWRGQLRLFAEVVGWRQLRSMRRSLSIISLSTVRCIENPECLK
jgi:hypothetical protein